MRTQPRDVEESCGTSCATPARWVIGLWRSRCTERILMVRDPRGFRKEALMLCVNEGPS